MKLRRFILWPATACACVGLVFGSLELSRARASAAQDMPAHRELDAKGPPGPVPGMALLMVTPWPRIPVEPGLPIVPDDEATPQTHAAILRLARREIFFQALQDPDSGIKKTAWFKELQGDKRPDAVIDAIDKATTVETIPDTSLVVVTVSIQPPADAATIANAFCSAYIEGRRSRHYASTGTVIGLLDKEKNLLDLELNEEVLKKMAEVELRMPDSVISPLGVMDDEKDMKEALDRAMVQAMIERAEASADVEAERPGPRAATKPAQIDPAAQRLAAAERRLAALGNCRSALQKTSGDFPQMMAEYSVLKKRESGLRQRIQVLDDRLSNLRQFSLNSPWTDIEFAARASAR